MPDTTLAAEISLNPDYAYLDHAAKGPLTRSAAQALRDYADDVEEHGGVHFMRWLVQVAEVRERLATLIGADSSEVALMPNTAAGIGTIAEGLDWREGDNIVVPAAEFPSNLFPWRHLESRGVECRTVASPGGQIDLAALSASCDDRTRLIACSWVGWANGFRVDLDALCEIAQAKGCRLLVDGIQAIGMQPLDVAQTPIDFIAGEGRKWLLGPEGLGYLYVRQDALNEIRPTRVGWASMQQENVFGDEFSFRDDASRFSSGMESFPLVASLNASLGVLANQSPAERAASTETLRAYAVDKLRSIGGNVIEHAPANRSAIVTTLFGGYDIEAIRKHCWKAGVIVSARGGGIRISPHAYNTTDDIDRAVDALRDAMS